MPEKTATGRTIAPAVFALAALAVAAGTFSAVAGDATMAVWALPTAVGELAVGLLILLSAGGWGALALRKIMPSSAPKALLAFTACGLGLWLLSSAIMIAGSLVHGALSPYVWWPVVAVGAVLAMVQAWPTIRDWKLSGRVPLGSLVWLIVAAAAGLWLAGAVRPPGFIGMFYEGDAYDVLEYHLQLPRQFFEAGQITPLQNCFSHYPLGNEMLYLLAMCLRGGAYEGMYLATMLHGLQAAAAVAAIYLAMKRGVPPVSAAGRPFAAILLATTPGIIYLSWLAKTELAQVMYIALALLWLRQWLVSRSWPEAICIGLMLGGACATKYVAVGIVAAPVLVVMTVSGAFAGKPAAAPKRPLRTLAQATIAGTMVVLLLSPWLVRNAILVHNPVFPLAANSLGKAYWTDEQVRRWAAGTGPKWAPPVPVPARYQKPRVESDGDLLARNVLERPFLSQALLVLSAIAVVVVCAFRRRAFEMSLVGVLLLQVIVWVAMAHQLPWRFLIPAVAPLALLAGDLLSWVSRGFAGEDSINPRLAPRLAAVGLLLAATLWNLNAAKDLFLIDAQPRLAPPLTGQDIAHGATPYSYASSLPPGSRIMLVGDAKAFYFPPGTIYTPVFDPQPLEAMINEGLSGPQILRRLKEIGVTHLWVDWVEVRRLARTYGFPTSLSAGAIEAHQAGRPLTVPLLDELLALGATPTQLPEHNITVYQLP